MLAPRKVTALSSVHALTGHQYKRYAIHASAGSGQRTELMAARTRALLDSASELVSRYAPSAADGDRFNELGFLVLHEGALANWLLVFDWANDIHLFHRLYKNVPSANNVSWQVVDSGLIACTWELAIVAIEREAWLAALESRADSGEVRARYLSCSFSGWI
jgi:hypothetical protein